MSRKILHDFLAGQTLTWTVVRGKCRYGDRHESVRLVDGEWWGEDTRTTACAYAPQDVCPVCSGSGVVALGPDELAQYDGPTAATRPCTPCGGSGFVPGPHWPWRHDCPPPLKVAPD